MTLYGDFTAVAKILLTIISLKIDGYVSLFPFRTATIFVTDIYSFSHNRGQK
jgi:hypothetical protein